jgi:hypothetical protein
MRLLRLICAFNAIVLLAALAPPPHLSSSSWLRLESAIKRNAESAMSGDAIPLRGGIHGSIRLRAKMSGSDPTGDCADCQDPCRSFTADAGDVTGNGTFFGNVCRDPSSGAWNVTHIDIETWTEAEMPPSQIQPPSIPSTPHPPPRLQPPPPADREIIASIRHNLFLLHYLRDENDTGNSDFDAAMGAFAADAGIDVPAASSTSRLQFNAELNKAVERGKQATCNIPSADRRAYTMCATLGEE